MASRTAAKSTPASTPTKAATPAKAAATPAKAANGTPAKANGTPAAPAPEAVTAATPPKKAAAPKKAPAPKKAATPVAAPEPAAAESAGDEGADANESSSVSVMDKLGLSIAPARCRAHITELLGDPAVEEKIKDLRKRAAEAGDEAAKKALHDEALALSRGLIRLAAATPLTVAAVADTAVKDLVELALRTAHQSNDKIMHPSHYHGNTVNHSVALPLVNKLPAFVGYSEAREKALEEEQKLRNKAVREAREKKKEGAAADAADAAEPAEPTHSRNTFSTYIDDAIDAIKATTPDYETMRTSARMRTDLTEMTAELIRRVVNIACIMIKMVDDSRTMQPKHIKAAVVVLMKEEGRSEEQIAEIIAAIDEKLEIFAEHQRGEKEKKVAALTDDERAEIEAKKAAAELERKKRALEAERKRAVAAANAAKTLAKELEGQ